MIHEINLAIEPFNAIRNGTKTIESRLFDKKRRAIKVGDQLIFTNREDPTQKVKATVVGLLKYPSFEQLFSENDPAKFGEESAERLLAQIRQFYPLGAEKKIGVLGIEFTVNSL